MYELSLNDKAMTFKELERRIYKYVCDEACNALKNILESLDEKLLNERDSSVYRNKGRKKTCLRTIMGNVEYYRRIYQFKLEDGKKATKCLLDEYLGMDTIGNVSINLVETILTNVTEVSFRKTSKNIKTMCNQEISAQGVWNIVQTLGEKIKELENRKIELDDKGLLKGEKEVPVLFQEQDGVWLYLQGKDRPKGKNKKKELKLAVSYTGWTLRPGSKKEYVVVDKTVCASFSNSSRFKKLANATISEKYNVDEIKTRILNGDGAPWIKSNCEDQDIHFQLDPFHISQAIIRKVSEKKSQKKLLKLFREGKVEDGLEMIIQLMIENSKDEKSLKKLEDLYNYLISNRDGLIPYKQRDIDLPTAPEGLEYRQLGTMEHNICDVLAQRMKGRKMSWSINGADNLAKILSEKFSNRLFDTVDKIYRNIIPDDVINTVVAKLPLTVFEANKESNKCKVYKCTSSQIPYSGAAATLGRKIIRDLCGLKSFSDISYN
ncbi:ISLre2 family transposase [Clostridium sp. C2-6-12]|uniref:ISLre2 family transposase n=1 Tax=Clostridium sp. C2-6-12 TaxID=2698832 RepID=UPI00136CA154|nr:ISLre2 family transposase [Clostridium sp. C2-6-12]